MRGHKCPCGTLAPDGGSWGNTILGKVSSAENDAGTFIFDNDGGTYGGNYHSENGKVTSIAWSSLNEASNGGWLAASQTVISLFSGAVNRADQANNGNVPGAGSDVIYDNNNAIGLGIGIVEPGFGAAWDAVRAAPGAYTNSAKIISKAGGIGLVGLNVALTGYTLYNEKQNGTFNTHSIVNGAVTVVGVGLTITGLVISAPVVAIIGVGVGIGYGIAQVSGIDGWIDSNWGFNNKTPK